MNQENDLKEIVIKKFLVDKLPNLGSNVVNPNSIKYVTLLW